MRIVKIVSVAVMFISAAYFVNVYDYTVPLIEGGDQPLTAYQEKKILIITLPVQRSASADSLLYSLDTLSSAHITTVVTIAVPSYEDGYIPSQKDSLRQWYRSILGNHVILTDGLYTRKISGSSQHPLFNWLTTVAANGNFDLDVEGAGQMFFINGTGKIYGVLVPAFRVSSPAVQKILQMQ